MDVTPTPPPRGVTNRTRTTRLMLADGNWLEVRDEITAGERDDAYEVAYETAFSVAEGLKVQLNRRLLRFAQVAVHIVAWSFRRQDGAELLWGARPVEGGHGSRPTTLAERVAILRDELLPQEWDEVYDVVNARITVIEAERAAKKKTPGTGAVAESTSPSVG